MVDEVANVAAIFWVARIVNDQKMLMLVLSYEMEGFVEENDFKLQLQGWFLIQ